jgi:CRP/FNR family cyclic AMP-dependent transcriptional regulator
MHLEESKRILKTSGLFQGLKDSHMDIILMICEEVRPLAGVYVFREGDPGNAVYLIVQGAVEIVLEPRNESESPIAVAVMAPTSTFGEVTLVERDSTRTASVRCRTDAQLIRIPSDRLLRVCRDYPEIGFQVMQRIAAELAGKLRSSNLSIREYHLFYKPLDEDDSTPPVPLPERSPIDAERPPL